MRSDKSLHKKLSYLKNPPVDIWAWQEPRAKEEDATKWKKALYPHKVYLHHYTGFCVKKGVDFEATNPQSFLDSRVLMLEVTLNITKRLNTNPKSNPSHTQPCQTASAYEPPSTAFPSAKEKPSCMNENDPLQKNSRKACMSSLSTPQSIPAVHNAEKHREPQKYDQNHHNASSCMDISCTMHNAPETHTSDPEPINNPICMNAGPPMPHLNYAGGSVDIYNQYYIPDTHSLLAETSNPTKTTITIINVYAPVIAAEREEFFMNLTKLIPKDSNVIMLGDFNSYCNPALDRWPEQDPNSDQHTQLTQIVTDLNFLDTIPDKVPEFRQMTRNHITRGKIKTATRIDAIFASPDIHCLIHKHSTTPSSISDHKMVSVHLNTGVVDKTPKWTKILPMDASSKQMRRSIVQTMKAVNFGPNTQILDCWAKFKSLLVIKSNHKASQRWHRYTALYRQALRERDHLDRTCPKGVYSHKWAIRWAANFRTIKNFEDRIHAVLLLQAGAKHTAENEKSSPYFLSRFKARTNGSRMSEVRTASGATANTPEEVAKECHRFYTQLYATDVVDVPSHAAKIRESSLLQNITLPNPPPQSLMHPVTTDELEEILKSLPRRKSPGPDGIPYELYTKNMEIIMPMLLALLNHCLQEIKLIPGSTDSFIVTLFKKGDPLSLANWRPIALSNTDAKILTKLLAKRLGQLATELISPNQFGFVPNRSIWDNIHQVTNVTRSKTPGILCFLDQEKAYDRVDWIYSEETLRCFGLEERFVKWASLFTRSATMQIVGPGFRTDTIIPGRGFKQGDPISPLLYNFSIEPLLLSLNKNLTGITIEMQDPIRALAFADDMALALSTPADVRATELAITEYQNISQAKLNVTKSQTIILNGCRLKTPFNIPKTSDPVRHLGIYLTATGTADTLMEDILLKGITSRISQWRRRKVTTLGRVQLINTFVTSKMSYVAHIVPFTTKFFTSITSHIQRWVWDTPRPPLKMDTLTPKKELGGMGLRDPKKIADKAFSKLLVGILTHPRKDDTNSMVAARVLLCRSLNITLPRTPTQLSKWFANNPGATGPHHLDIYWKKVLKYMKTFNWTVQFSLGVPTHGVKPHIYTIMKDGAPYPPPLPSPASNPSQDPVPLPPPMLVTIPSFPADAKDIWEECFNPIIPPKMRSHNWKILNGAYRTAERTNIEFRNCRICGQYDSAEHRFFSCTIPSILWSLFQATISPIASSPTRPIDWFMLTTKSNPYHHLLSTLFSVTLWVSHSCYIEVLKTGQITSTEILQRYSSITSSVIGNAILGNCWPSSTAIMISKWSDAPILKFDHDKSSCAIISIPIFTPLATVLASPPRAASHPNPSL